MKNTLIRLAELIQEGFPEDLVAVFKATDPVPPLAERVALIGRAINTHQACAEQLWLNAGRKRTPEERRATARADLASFVFAYLTGDPKEYAETAIEALHALGRQSEVDLIGGLCRK